MEDATPSQVRIRTAALSFLELGVLVAGSCRICRSLGPWKGLNWKRKSDNLPGPR